MDIKKGSVKLLLLVSVVLFLMSIVFGYFAPENITSRSVLLLTPFFLTVSLVSRILLLKAVSKDIKKLTQYFFSITAMKFILYLGVIIAYGFLFRDDAVVFIISFFLFYIIYTFLDMKAFVKISGK
jgi:hypothetical protein